MTQANPLETDVRVPLAIRGPGITPGTATLPSVLMTNIDLAPTMLEWAGAPNAWPSGVGVRDGRSLVPVLAAAAAAARTSTVAVAAPVGWRDRLLLEFVGWQASDWVSTVLLSEMRGCLLQYLEALNLCLTCILHSV